MQIDAFRELTLNSFSNQREQDQFIIDHATHFIVGYLTAKTKLKSEKLPDLEMARMVAKFTASVAKKRIQIIAILEPSEGSSHNKKYAQALVEIIDGANGDEQG